MHPERTEIYPHITIEKPVRRAGTLTYLAVLLGAMGLILFAPKNHLPLSLALGFVLTALFFPASFRRLLQVRWLFLLGTLPLISALWMGAIDRSFAGIAYSSEGLASGMIMSLRAAIILVLVDGFSGVVEITEIAGLAEKIGLKGLGFSAGIAFNLLSVLNQSSVNTWRSLWMRGGLRHKRWRGLQLYLLTVVSNAIRRAEEIALAAEARAFSPEKARPMPMKRGSLDWVVIAAIIVMNAAVWLLR